MAYKEENGTPGTPQGGESPMSTLSPSTVADRTPTRLEARVRERDEKIALLEGKLKGLQDNMAVQQREMQSQVH